MLVGRLSIVDSEVTIYRCCNSFFVVYVSIATKFILNKVGSSKFDNAAKTNPNTNEDNKEVGQNKCDETTYDMENGNCDGDLRKGDASLESPLVKDRSLREQISPRIKTGVDGGNSKSILTPDNAEVEQKRPLQGTDEGGRLLKKAKYDVAENVKVSNTKSNDKEKSSKETLVQLKNKSVSPSEPIVKDIGPTTKMSQEKSKLSNAKMVKTSSKDTRDDEDIMDYRQKEVSRRPDLDNKSKWFTKLPWEERMEAANKKGMLVLLRNLDPAYTSTDVEDIVWHGLKLHCTAKMIQHSAISSPHSGEAFVIFKTREAAERALKKLDEGCLLLPNGRPLVGCIGDPSFRDKQSTFHGHLVFSRSRQPPNREEAVSTSHCSQCNTIEYEMAIDWCFLQEKWDRAWQLLYKQQGEELRKLRGSFKCK